MINKKGSILIQTLINLMIFSMFMTLSFQSIFVLSKPISIHHLKYDYLQLQLQYLAALHNGVIVVNDKMCFKDDHCIEMQGHRLILTPGHQILLENIEAYVLHDLNDLVQLKVVHLNEWVVFYVRK
jgi:hypothetical protein